MCCTINERGYRKFTEARYNMSKKRLIQTMNKSFDNTEKRRGEKLIYSERIKMIIQQLNNDEDKIECIFSKKIFNIALSNKEIVQIAKTLEKDFNRKKVIGKAKKLGLTKENVCEIATSFIYDNSKKEFLEKMPKEGYTAKELSIVIESFKLDKNKLEIINNEKTRSEYRLQLKKIIKSLKYENSKQNVIEKAKEYRTIENRYSFNYFRAKI